MSSPSIQSLCFLTGSRIYISLHPSTANMQVPLLQTHAFFHCSPCMKHPSFFIHQYHYSFYAPGHRSVPKESKGSYGKYIHMYIWYSWWINIDCKYHTATLALPETSNQYTRTSFSSAFFLSPLHLLVCSMLHISSYFLYHLVCLYIYIQLFLLENYLLTSIYSVAIMRSK